MELQKYDRQISVQPIDRTVQYNPAPVTNEYVPEKDFGLIDSFSAALKNVGNMFGSIGKIFEQRKEASDNDAAIRLANEGSQRFSESLEGYKRTGQHSQEEFLRIQKETEEYISKHAENDKQASRALAMFSNDATAQYKRYNTVEWAQWAENYQQSLHQRVDRIFRQNVDNVNEAMIEVIPLLEQAVKDGIMREEDLYIFNGNIEGYEHNDVHRVGYHVLDALREADIYAGMDHHARTEAWGEIQKEEQAAYEAALADYEDFQENVAPYLEYMPIQARDQITIPEKPVPPEDHIGQKEGITNFVEELFNKDLLSRLQPNDEIMQVINEAKKEIAQDYNNGSKKAVERLTTNLQYLQDLGVLAPEISDSISQVESRKLPELDVEVFKNYLQAAETGDESATAYFKQMYDKGIIISPAMREKEEHFQRIQVEEDLSRRGNLQASQLIRMRDEEGQYVYGSELGWLTTSVREEMYDKFMENRKQEKWNKDQIISAHNDLYGQVLMGEIMTTNFGMTDLNAFYNGQRNGDLAQLPTTKMEESQYNFLKSVITERDRVNEETSKLSAIEFQMSLENDIAAWKRKLDNSGFNNDNEARQAYQIIVASYQSSAEGHEEKMKAVAAKGAPGPLESHIKSYFDARQIDGTATVTSVGKRLGLPQDVLTTYEAKTTRAIKDLMFDSQGNQRVVDPVVLNQLVSNMTNQMIAENFSRISSDLEKHLTASDKKLIESVRGGYISGFSDKDIADSLKTLENLNTRSRRWGIFSTRDAHPAIHAINAGRFIGMENHLYAQTYRELINPQAQEIFGEALEGVQMAVGGMPVYRISPTSPEIARDIVSRMLPRFNAMDPSDQAAMVNKVSRGGSYGLHVVTDEAQVKALKVKDTSAQIFVPLEEISRDYPVRNIENVESTGTTVSIMDDNGLRAYTNVNGQLFDVRRIMQGEYENIRYLQPDENSQIGTLEINGRRYPMRSPF